MNASALNSGLTDNVTAAKPIYWGSYYTKSLPEIIIVLTILGIGGITNLINIVVFARFKNNSSIVFMQFISLGDVLACLGIFPAFLYLRYNYTHTHWFIHMVITGRCINAIAVGFSVLLAVVISVQRLLVTTCPTHNRLRSSTTSAFIISVSLLVFCVFAKSPFCIAIYRVKQMEIGGALASYSASDRSGTIGVLLLAAACVFDYGSPLLLFICNFGIIINLIRSRHIRKDMAADSSSQNRDNRENRLIVSLIIVSLITAFAMTPVTAMRLSSVSYPTYRMLEPYFDTIYILNHSSNFFIYVATLREFRCHLRKLCLQICHSYAPSKDVNWDMSMQTGVSSIAESDNIDKENYV